MAILRSDADKILAELLRQVDFHPEIDLVVVFNSYLSDKDPIGDIDVAIGINWQFTWEPWHMAVWRAGLQDPLNALSLVNLDKVNLENKLNAVVFRRRQ